MTTEQIDNTEDAEVGAQNESPQPVTGALMFTVEQQVHIDKLIGERLKRAQEKWQADLEARSEAERKTAEAKRLKEEQRWQELAQTQEAKAVEAESRLVEAQSQLERAKGVIEGLVETRKKDLPEPMLKALEGRDIYDQLEIANAYLEAVPAQPAAVATPPRQAVTKPTPVVQGPRDLTPEERRQKAARIW